MLDKKHRAVIISETAKANFEKILRETIENFGNPCTKINLKIRWIYKYHFIPTQSVRLLSPFKKHQKIYLD